MATAVTGPGRWSTRSAQGRVQKNQEPPDPWLLHASPVDRILYPSLILKCTLSHAFKHRILLNTNEIESRGHDQSHGKSETSHQPGARSRERSVRPLQPSACLPRPALTWGLSTAPPKVMCGLEGRSSVGGITQHFL